MDLVVQLVLAVAVFGVTLSGGSLVWPKITSAPRPQLLTAVHDSVIKTPVGAQAAQVLGVTDETNVQPINVGQVAQGALYGVKNAIQKRASTIIMAQVMGQLTNQYEKLPEEQKIELQEIICTNTSTPAGVVQ